MRALQRSLRCEFAMPGNSVAMMPIIAAILFFV